MLVNTPSPWVSPSLTPPPPHPVQHLPDDVSDPARHFFTHLCAQDRRQRLGYGETKGRCEVCADGYLAGVDVAALYRGPGPLSPQGLAGVVPDPRALALGAFLNSNEALASGVPGSPSRSPQPHDGSPQNGSPQAPSSPTGAGAGASAGASAGAGAGAGGAAAFDDQSQSLPHAWLASEEVFNDPDFPAFTIW